MHIYDVSTIRRVKHEVQINWSRECTFSTRQINFISQNTPISRGIYCIYAKNQTFAYESRRWPNRRCSRVVYIGCGWLDQRLVHHLRYGKNSVLTGFIENFDLAFRWDRISDTDPIIDYPRAIEAALLSLFQEKFDLMPPANRREERTPELGCDEFTIAQSSNFDFLAQG